MLNVKLKGYIRDGNLKNKLQYICIDKLMKVLFFFIM